MVAPLEDVTVIEIDNWMATPSAGAILADLGANVIKVEPLTGDPMRDMGRPAKVPEDKKGFDYQFDVSNRGKRSIAVDLESGPGLDVVLRLVASADVFMCNLLQHRQERFGLDPTAIKKVNNRIVHATLTDTAPQALKRTDPDMTYGVFGRSGLYDAMRRGNWGRFHGSARPRRPHHWISFVGAILAALRLAES